MNPTRRQWLLASALLAGLPLTQAAETARELEFPRDHGAHPDFRTEWWYVTGQLRRVRGAASNDAAAEAIATPDYGFQITFFRSRVDVTQGMQSSFAAKDLIFAHSAITDVEGKKLWHDQRIARASGAGPTDLAHASRRDAALDLRDWTLKRSNLANATDPDAEPGSVYQARVSTTDFALLLQLKTSEPLLLQGVRGWSRKGPQPQQASFYYSEPQLRASGALTLQGQRYEVQGRAWLDHEWSEEMLPPGAVGWDWLGMNLVDGSSLTAFRIRDAKDQSLWDGGSFRDLKSVGGRYQRFARGDLKFRPLRVWKSPSSGASYPVEWLLHTPIDVYTVRALVEDQELDSRQSTGAIYWEGLSELLNSNGERVGLGYLEMTGYASAIKM